MRKIIVTGSTGFVGQWLTEKLIRLGHEVIIPVRNLEKAKDLIELGAIAESYDLTNKSSVESVFLKHKPDSVFHLAGLIGYTKEMRQAMYKANVIGTQNIVDACLSKGVDRLVYISSVVAIGAGQRPSQILNENSKYNVKKYDFGYFETKKEAEEIVMAACKDKGLNAVTLNPSTIYGPGDAAKGSRKTQLKVAKGKLPFYTAGGASIIHIKDLIDATITAWEKGQSGERYILSGENITIKKLFSIIAKSNNVSAPKIRLPRFVLLLAARICNLLGKKSPVSVENAYIATMYHWFDNNKAVNALGLNITPAETTINDSIQWARQNGYLD